MPVRVVDTVGAVQTHMVRPGSTRFPTTGSGGLVISDAAGQFQRSFVDFRMSGDCNPAHHLVVGAASRSSSAVERHSMAKSTKEATGQRNLKISSPTYTATEPNLQGSPSCVTTADIMQCAVSTEGPTSSVDSGQYESFRHDDKKKKKKRPRNAAEVAGHADTDTSALHRRKKVTGLTSGVASDGDAGTVSPPIVKFREPSELECRDECRDVSTPTQFSDPAQTCRKLLDQDDIDEDDEKHVVLQAATALLMLASSESDDLLLASSSSSLAGNRPPSGGETGATGTAASGSSVLSRPSNKRRYRLVMDLLAETPRVCED